MTTTLSWDDVGTRYYEGGVDRAVLYPPIGPGVAWSGLISANESLVGGESSGIYFDGTKYAIASAIPEFAGTLRAVTYPDELLEFEGVLDAGVGLHISNQEVVRFGLTYRTKIGNDEDGFDHGYKIHLLYNLYAVPSDKAYLSFSGDTSPTIFEWKVTSIPSEVPGYRATSHLIFDSRQMDPIFLSDIENTLYGDGTSAPMLPTAGTIVGFTENWVVIRITDNGDETWTVEGPDDLVFLTSATEFTILQANTKTIDANTFYISDTTK